MIVFPKSKINLGLRITGKREDGYHDIETIFFPIDLCDALEIVLNPAGKEDIFTLTGSYSAGLRDDNLVLKAIHKMKSLINFPPVMVHLHKAIPTGAGLGGGSSDAACTIRLLNRIFDLGMSVEDMKGIALTLGSDCPFFIDCIASYATGRGEILEPLAVELKGKYIVLVNKGISVSTREAYEGCIPVIPAEKLTSVIMQPVIEWRSSLINDFEKTVFLKYPEIASLKKGLYDSGALYSSMSGSGSTVFGIYDKRPELPADLREYVIYEGEL
jgi:4-diphosphocytidyl-2-C-methyl-D-erythritol kinase